MKMIVLVAGVGSRLRPLTDNRPKCLVEVSGQTILHRLLSQAYETGLFEEVVLVTGYFQEKVELFVAEWNDRIDIKLRARTVHNPRFSETNNGYSLWCARADLVEGFVLSDGDLVLEDGLLNKVADSSLTGTHSILAVDTKANLDAEAMKFTTDETGSIRQLSKHISTEEGEGESIGLCRISSVDAQNIVRFLNQLIDSGSFNEYYERAFQEYLSMGWKPGAVEIGDFSWVEIDDLQDLKKAEGRFGHR